ncbi:Calx-beta domain-containing protein, partial [Pedobacter frigidisoli]|uniref:Calx-beta domain-containing protein n=1 Tax=Pedobacter frigidisoli TaxID=2530455 RepID=UPI002931D379
MNKALLFSRGFARIFNRSHNYLTKKFVGYFVFAMFFVSIVMLGNEANAQTFPYKNSFKTNNTTGLVLGGTASASLTSGGVDPSGDGVLRLTNANTNQKGFAYINQNFPFSRGIHAEFEYFTYGGTRADGITFFLFDGSQTFDIGQFGGALGYAQNANAAANQGMNAGFLALGLDEYGNFGVATETKNGGFTNTAGNTQTNRVDVDGMVVVRGAVGPNNARFGNQAYPFVNGKVTSANNTINSSFILPAADQFTLSTSSRIVNNLLSGYRKVRFDVVKRTGTDTGFSISVDIYVGEKNRWVTILNNAPYVIADSRIPSTLKAGFAASTGGSTNFHEIRNVNITPSAQQLQTPVANNDAATTFINNSAGITINVLANDNTTINGPDPVLNSAQGTYASGTLDLNPATDGIIDQTYTVAGQGTFTVDDAGLVTFVPATGFSGTVTANYTFEDTYLKKSTTGVITVTVEPRTDLSITKTANTNTPTVGGNIVFTLTAANAGPSPATGVTVTDALKSGYTFISANPSAAYNSSTGVWTIGNLASGANSVLTITASVNSAGDMSNSATIAGGQNDPVTTNNTANITNINPVVSTVCSTNLITGTPAGFDSNIGITNNNGNNVQSGNTYDGWSTVSGANGLFNIVKVDGTGYAAGPDLAHNGSQYLDIANNAGTVTRPFTTTKPSIISYTGWFSSRTFNGSYADWTGTIDIRNADQSAIAGVTGATSSGVSFTSATDLETWFFVSGKTSVVPAGTYLYRANLGNEGNFDDAFLCAYEVPIVNLSTANATVAENVGSATYSVTLAGTAGIVLQSAVTVNVTTAPGTATAADYGTPSVTSVTFPIGTVVGSAAGTVNFTIPIVDDAISETTESFTANISGLTGSAVLGTNSVTTNITDNDASSLAINNVTVAENISGGNATFTVTLTGAIQNAVTVDYATANGT